MRASASCTKLCANPVAAVIALQSVSETAITPRREPRSEIRATGIPASV
jgi:hypothetical protein